MESELKLLSSKRDKIEEDLGMTSVALTSAELSSLKESLATAEKVAARADLDAEKAGARFLTEGTNQSRTYLRYAR